MLEHRAREMNSMLKTCGEQTNSVKLNKILLCFRDIGVDENELRFWVRYVNATLSTIKANMLPDLRYELNVNLHDLTLLVWLPTVTTSRCDHRNLHTPEAASAAVHRVLMWSHRQAMERERMTAQVNFDLVFQDL